MSLPDKSRGTLVSVEKLSSHSALKLRIAQRIARIPKRFPVRHGIVLYRITYWTELSGKPQLATGLLGIPKNHRAQTSVMWMNGTNPTRSEAPSAGGLVGLLVGALFAGSGHLLLAPDYIGLGTSDNYHPYMHAVSTVDAATDFIRAVASHCDSEGMEWCPRLMLVGYSQGAHAVAGRSACFCVHCATPGPGERHVAVGFGRSCSKSQHLPCIHCTLVLARLQPRSRILAH